MLTVLSEMFVVKLLPLMRDLFKKASQNTDGIELATDLDYSIQIDRKIGAMRRLAAAEAARGNTVCSI